MTSAPLLSPVTFRQILLAGLFLLVVITPPPIRADAATDAFGKAADALKSEHYDLAIADYSDAIRLNPNYSAAYNNRGLAYDAKNDHDKAIADYTEAIRLDPNLAEAYFNRGHACDATHDYDKAIANYNEAIRINPKDANAYFNRGTAYLGKNDNDKAIADYTEAIRLDPNGAEAYFNRGNAYLGKNDNDSAISDYNNAITSPQNRPGRTATGASPTTRRAITMKPLPIAPKPSASTQI